MIHKNTGRNMSEKTTKSIRNIENKMEEVSEASLRYKALKSAKDFKTSWIELGQTLFSVWQDKMYKDWGFEEFDSYTQKEIGIRKQTALKLLRSYSFLEREEPRYIKKDYAEAAEAGTVPTYEAVDVLRQAKNKELDRQDYANIRKYVLEDGKDAKDVKKDLTQMIKQREDIDPEEARKKKRLQVLKRMVSLLRSVRKEIKISNILPEKELKEIGRIIDVLDAELLEEK